ncbi:keywimysin-related RiPP [Marinitenerispora sediminis]|uniref:Putative RiPP n=1 Tax=Marinitenerispora sediminis TaxID=1931232 RepID=A0A368T5R0_9ACTN|nr:keywimysin-related RiPP [Marinitenerispora sediminis]RCV52251.1 putative RiPP precursor [Marinitenerispora sediminis]RCV56880.1 putative RiPP precursor [Marinitenerispora sediminis]RCV59043.1 putative RiPP precursor [Marinitenerispora sediminis]
MHDTAVYETPVLVEVGDFAELTTGYGLYPVYDGWDFGIWP